MAAVDRRGGVHSWRSAERSRSHLPCLSAEACSRARTRSASVPMSESRCCSNAFTLACSASVCTVVLHTTRRGACAITCDVGQLDHRRLLRAEGGIHTCMLDGWAGEYLCVNSSSEWRAVTERSSSRNRMISCSAAARAFFSSSHERRRPVQCHKPRVRALACDGPFVWPAWRGRLWQAAQCIASRGAALSRF